MEVTSGKVDEGKGGEGKGEEENKNWYSLFLDKSYAPM